MADQWASIIHKWYDIPKPLVFNGSNLKMAVFADKTLKLELKGNESEFRPSRIFHNSYKPNGSRVHGFYTSNDGFHQPFSKRTKWYNTFPTLDDDLGSFRDSPKGPCEFPPKIIDIVSRTRVVAAAMELPQVDPSELAREEEVG